MKKIVSLSIFIHLFSVTASCSQVVGGKPQKVDDIFLPDGEGIKVTVWVENLESPGRFFSYRTEGCW